MSRNVFNEVWCTDVGSNLVSISLARQSNQIILSSLHKICDVVLLVFERCLKFRVLFILMIDLSVWLWLYSSRGKLSKTHGRKALTVRPVCPRVKKNLTNSWQTLGNFFSTAMWLTNNKAKELTLKGASSDMITNYPKSTKTIARSSFYLTDVSWLPNYCR